MYLIERKVLEGKIIILFLVIATGIHSLTVSTNLPGLALGKIWKQVKILL